MCFHNFTVLIYLHCTQLWNLKYFSYFLMRKRSVHSRSIFSLDEKWFIFLNVQDQKLLVVLHSVMNLFLSILFYLCIPLSLFLYLTGLHGSSGKLTGSTSSLNKLSVQSSGNRRSQSSSLLDMGNMSASDLDVADRTKFDKVRQKCCLGILPTFGLKLSCISFSSIKKKKVHVFGVRRERNGSSSERLKNNFHVLH